MPTETTTIDLPSLTEIQPYNEVRAEMARLAEENEQVVFEYDTPAGAKAAKSHIYKFRTLKGNIERERKKLKADALEYGRRVDGAAKQLVAQVDDMIAVHQQPLDEIKAREAKRTRRIQDAINSIFTSSIDLTTDPTAQQIAEAIERVEKIAIDPDVFEERTDEAQKLKDDELFSLRASHETTKLREAEQAELHRLRAEAARREQEDRDRQIAAEAEARAKAEAEAQARAERYAAAQREEELRQQAEQARIDAEQAKAQAEAEAWQREEAQKAAEAKRRADAQHAATVMAEAADAIASTVGLSLTNAIDVVDAIHNGNVPHVHLKF